MYKNSGGISIIIVGNKILWPYLSKYLDIKVKVYRKDYDRNSSHYCQDNNSGTIIKITITVTKNTKTRTAYMSSKSM